MKPLIEMLVAEEAKWRAKSYEEIASILGTVQCYQPRQSDSRFEIEVHSRQGTRKDEIVVMVECAPEKKVMGTFIGQAKYFVISKTAGVRDIERDEAF
jgi:hypothetical protein